MMASSGNLYVVVVVVVLTRAANHGGKETRGPHRLPLFIKQEMTASWSILYFRRTESIALLFKASAYMNGRLRDKARSMNCSMLPGDRKAKKELSATYDNVVI